MKFYQIVFFFTFFLPLLLQAQSIGISDDKKMAGVTQLQQVVTFGETGFAAIIVDDPNDPRVTSLRFFTWQDSLLAERQIPIGDQQLPGQLEGAFRWGDYLVVLTSVYYPGPQRNNLLLRRFTIPTLDEIDARKIDEAYTPPQQRIPFNYSLSPDSSRLLTYAWSYTEPGDLARLSLQVLDRDLKSVWDREMALPYANQVFYLYGALLDRKGNAYLLCEEYLGNVSPNMTINEKKIKQVILYTTPDLPEPREFAIRPGELLLDGARFTLNENDQLIGAAFYRRANKNRTEGIVTLRIDGGANLLEHQLIPVDKDTYRNSLFNGRGDYYFFDYSIDHLWAAGGQLYLTAEQLIQQSDYYNPVRFGDILVARIDDLKRLSWLKRIPRSAEGAWEEVPQYSYFAFRQDDNIRLLYAEFRGNTQRFSYQGTLATISPQGTVQRQDITQVIRKRQAQQPLPARSWGPAGNKLLLLDTRLTNAGPQYLLMPVNWSELMDSPVMRNE